jgi:starvation-inducible DNA-binding protein
MFTQEPSKGGRDNGGQAARTRAAEAPPVSDIGIGEDERKDICIALSRLLADTYTLYLKTHNFHWNVTGPQFRTLHLMFEEQYNQLHDAVDDVAERIRSLGGRAPATYRQFGELTSIPEPDVQLSSDEMVRQLVLDHDTVIRTARTALGLCESARDAAGVDLISKRLGYHEKTAWMLRSLLEV